MNILPLIVGSIFFTVGLNIIRGYLRFKRLGTKVKGRVKAIEKYQSTSMSTHGHNHQTTSTYYRPVIEYLYKNETKILVGCIGSSEIRHKLNQQLNILIIESDDGEVKTRIEDGMNYTMGIILLLIGIVSIAIYIFYAGGSIITAAIVFTIILTIGIAITKLIRNIKGLVTSISDIQSIKDNADSDSVFIETKADYLKEISSHSLWGNIIAYSLMLGSFGIIYAGHSQLPNDAQNLLANDFMGFFNTITSGSLPSSWESPLIISGIGILFFFASLHSVLYVRRKYGGMSRI